MAALKLPKLPDRAPVKISISVTPELKRALDDYAILYLETYGEEQPIVQLIPQMLEEFLASDRAFSKRRAK